MSSFRPIKCLLIFCTLLAILVSACKDEIIIDDTDKKYPLDLRLTVEDEIPTFSWDKAKVSGFGGYTLVRSTDSIPTGLKPSIAGTTVLQSNKKDEVNFTDSATPIATNIHYKLYLKVGDRFLESPDIKFQQSIGTIDATADVSYFMPDSNWVVIFSANQSKVFLFDYAKKKLLSTVGMPFVNSSEMSVTSTIENNKPILFFGNSFDKLYKLELPSLITLKSSILSFSLYGLATNGNQLIETKSDFNTAISIKRTVDLIEQKNYTRNNYFERRSLVLLDPVSNRFAESSSSTITAFNLNPSTGTIINPTAVNTLTSSFTWQVVPISPDRQFFIPYNDGSVYDKDLNRLPVNIALNNVVDYSFSPDGKFLYSLSFSPSFQDALVTQFSVPNFEKKTERTLVMVAPRKIQGLNDGVQLVGINNLTGVTTIIKKIKF